MSDLTHADRQVVAFALPASGRQDLGDAPYRVQDLGAGDIGRGRGGWHALRDPAGLAFCVTANSPEATRHRDIG